MVVLAINWTITWWVSRGLAAPALGDEGEQPMLDPLFHRRGYWLVGPRGPVLARKSPLLAERDKPKKEMQSSVSGRAHRPHTVQAPLVLDRIKNPRS